MEKQFKKGKLLTEDKKIFLNNIKNKNENIFERAPIIDKALLINEEFDKMIKSLNNITKDKN